MEDTRVSLEIRGPRSGHRKTQRAQEYSGLAILLLSLVAGVVLVVDGQDPYIPPWLWLGLLLTCIACIFFPTSGTLGRRAELVTYTISVVSSWALVITMPDMGMLVVLLIVVAAAGIYLVPMWTVICIIVINCVIVSVQMWVHGSQPTDYLATGAFYLILHLAAVFSVYALSRESKLRSGLEQKTTELEAASVLLENAAKTAERLRISRELHDLIGHQLTVLNLELEAAKHRDGDQARQHMDQAAVVAKDLLADVRTTVGELRAAGQGNLRDAFQRIASAVQSMEISVEVDDEVTVDEQQAEALVRAGQEIVTNAVKHAEAKELWLTVCQDDSGVTLTAANDGLTPRKFIPGHGLQGLHERVELLGGDLTVRPHPIFTVEVTLPPSIVRQTQS